MVTEFEIRREVASITSTPMAPMRRVRRLLRVAKKVHSGAITLATLSLRALQGGDEAASTRFREAARRLVELHDEIRSQACQEMSTTGRGPVEALA